MRRKVAAIAAVVSFVAVMVLREFAGRALGINTYIDFGGPVTTDRGLYEEEATGESTDFGGFGFVAGAMLAWRIYHWILAGRIDGGLTRDQRDLWLAWFVGAVLYTTLSVLVTRTGLPGLISLPAKIAIAAGIFWLGRRWYRRQQAKRDWGQQLVDNLNRNVRDDTPTP